MYIAHHNNVAALAKSTNDITLITLKSTLSPTTSAKGLLAELRQFPLSIKSIL